MQTRIDHLVIGADDLAQGIAYVKEFLCVDIPYGGIHTKMGTHNHLMQLGNDIFLEVIAVNPDMKSPESPRWFGLDDPHVRKQIKKKPVLLNWVVNTKNIKELLGQANFSFGKKQLICRGNLSWYFGLPRDGRLLAGGMLPYAIEWQTDFHPSKNMADAGCRFQRLEIYHPNPTWFKTILTSIGAENLADIHALPENSIPYMIAYIDTPYGVKFLRS
ncbi:MAG: VOC family protein [Thermodesulfobacteriota bacterium]